MSCTLLQIYYLRDQSIKHTTAAIRCYIRSPSSPDLPAHSGRWPQDDGEEAGEADRQGNKVT